MELLIFRACHNCAMLIVSIFLTLCHIMYNIFYLTIYINMLYYRQLAITLAEQGGVSSMKNLFIKSLPPELAIALKVRAAEKDWKIRDMVIAALKAYLTAERGK